MFPLGTSGFSRRKEDEPIFSRSHGTGFLKWAQATVAVRSAGSHSRHTGPQGHQADGAGPSDPAARIHRSPQGHLRP